MEDVSLAKKEIESARLVGGEKQHLPKIGEKDITQLGNQAKGFRNLAFRLQGSPRSWQGTLTGMLVPVVALLWPRPSCSDNGRKGRVCETCLSSHEDCS